MPEAKQIVVDGVEDTIKGHSIRHAIAEQTVRARLRRGWDTEAAFLVPVGGPGHEPLTPIERATIAKRYRQGISATDLAKRYGCSRRHVYRIVEGDERRRSAAYCEEWDDITYWVPTHDGRPALYGDEGDVLVTVHRDPHGRQHALPCATLRYRVGVGYVDKEVCPHVIREEIREALLGSFETKAAS